jgi:hypothetical protein
LEEFVAVTALDEYIIAFRTLVLDGGFDLFYIVEFAEGTVDVLEVVTHEPYFIVMGGFQITDYLPMFLIAFGAKFTHLSQNGHFPVSLNQTEIVEGSLHGSGIGVIGIYNKMVPFCNGHLRAVVRWHIILQGCTDLLAVNAEVDTYGDSS